MPKKPESDFPFSSKTMAELEDRLVEVQRNWDNIGVSKYGQYVKQYKVWNIESKMDVTSVMFASGLIFLLLTLPI
jgi:hypothetical protein